MKTSANLYIWRNRSARFRLDLSTTTRDEAPPSPVARTVAALSFLAIIFLLTFASPASAVVNCFDYVKARLNEADVNPPPTGRLPEITKVEVFNNGGNLVMGNGIYEISGNTVYVNPNENGWSVRITVIAADENGNTQTIQIEKSLIKC